MFVCIGGITGQHIHPGTKTPDWESFKHVHAVSRAPNLYIVQPVSSRADTFGISASLEWRSLH